jgi:hypothetical protein
LFFHLILKLSFSLKTGQATQFAQHKISKHRNDQNLIAEHLAPYYSIAVAWVWNPAGQWLIADQTLGLRSVIPLQSAHLIREPRCEAFTSLT